MVVLRSFPPWNGFTFQHSKLSWDPHANLAESLSFPLVTNQACPLLERKVCLRITEVLCIFAGSVRYFYISPGLMLPIWGPQETP